MITIDEAIKHAREVAQKQRKDYEKCTYREVYGCNSCADYYSKPCDKCAKEHEQLADWLEELKIYRLVIKQCEEGSYMVNSKEFAKHMKEWVKEQKELREEKQNDGWISIDKRLPSTSNYILLSFSNFTIPTVGRYEVDEDGSGAFYIGDEIETCLSQDLFVNAWQQLPKPYKESE